MYLLCLSLVLLVGSSLCTNAAYENNSTTIVIDGEEYDLVGDIVYRKFESPLSLLRNSNTQNRWPGGVIPFYIDPASGYTQNEINVIRNSMNAITSQTGGCIRFVQRTNQASYVTIRHTNTGCNSFVGQVSPSRPQQISLQRPNCVVESVAIHELLHAVGQEHEQCRADRDYYVNILWNNISPGMEFNFQVSRGRSTFNQPYDFYSIMHYRTNAFSRNGQPTMMSKVAGVDSRRIGVANRMSQLDINKVRLLYGC